MEQISFDFNKALEEPPKTSSTDKPEGGYKFAEKDECQNCGNFFESTSTCPACMRNPKKVAYLEGLKKEKRN